MTKEIESYKVMGRHGTLNHVEIAEKERESDTHERKLKLRKEEAQAKAQRWMSTVYTTENLVVVPCSYGGKPIKGYTYEPVPAVERRLPTK